MLLPNILPTIQAMIEKDIMAPSVVCCLESGNAIESDVWNQQWHHNVIKICTVERREILHRFKTIKIKIINNNSEIYGGCKRRYRFHKFGRKLNIETADGTEDTFDAEKVNNSKLPNKNERDLAFAKFQGNSNSSLDQEIDITQTAWFENRDTHVTSFGTAIYI